MAETRSIDIGELRRLHAAAPEPYGAMPAMPTATYNFYRLAFERLPALLDAAEERDQLRAEVDRLLSAESAAAGREQDDFHKINRLTAARDALQQRLAARSEMPGLDELIGQLTKASGCRRCHCRSCGREGVGELHDHVCTDGEHCIETRERLRQVVAVRGLLLGRAAEALRRWANDQEAAPPDQQSDGEGDAAFVERMVERMHGRRSGAHMHAYVLDDIDRLIALARTAVTKPAGVRDEPVAWQWQTPTGWIEAISKGSAQSLAAHGHKVRALYTSPQPDAIEAAVLVEREACAKAADSAHRGPVGGGDGDTYICGTNNDAARAIRARSNSKGGDAPSTVSPTTSAAYSPAPLSPPTSPSGAVPDAAVEAFIESYQGSMGEAELVRTALTVALPHLSPMAAAIAVVEGLRDKADDEASTAESMDYDPAPYTQRARHFDEVLAALCQAQPEAERPVGACLMRNECHGDDPCPTCGGGPCTHPPSTERQAIADVRNAALEEAIKCFDEPMETWPTGWREKYPALVTPSVNEVQKRIRALRKPQSEGGES